MDERRWQQMQDIFARAVDLPPDAQRAAVEQMYSGDESLKTQVLDNVMDMLAEDRRANTLLDSSLDETARAVLDFGPLPSLVQREIGPYRLLKFLGEGGMGVVYLAERDDVGSLVAIKILRAAWLSPARRERFLRRDRRFGVIVRRRQRCQEEGEKEDEFAGAEFHGVGEVGGRRTYPFSTLRQDGSRPSFTRGGTL